MLRWDTRPARPHTSPRTLQARTLRWLRTPSRSGISSRTVDRCTPCRPRTWSCSRRSDRRPIAHSFRCSSGTPGDTRKRPPRHLSRSYRRNWESPPCLPFPRFHHPAFRSHCQHLRFRRSRLPLTCRLPQDRTRLQNQTCLPGSRSRQPRRRPTACPPHTRRGQLPKRPALVRMTHATADRRPPRGGARAASSAVYEDGKTSGDGDRPRGARSRASGRRSRPFVGVTVAPAPCCNNFDAKLTPRTGPLSGRRRVVTRSGAARALSLTRIALSRQVY